MTKAEIRTNILQWLFNRSDITPAIVDKIIHSVYISMAMPFKFHEVEASLYIDITANDGHYPLLTSDMYAVNYVRDASNGIRLSPFNSLSQFEEEVDQTVSGPPEKYIRWGNELILWPVPDYTMIGGILVRGWKLPVALADNESPIYPEDWHFIIELSAASLLAFMFSMDERAMMLQNIALGQLTGRQEAHTLESFFSTMGTNVERTRPRSTREGDWLR